MYKTIMLIKPRECVNGDGEKEVSLRFAGELKLRDFRYTRENDGMVTLPCKSYIIGCTEYLKRAMGIENKLEGDVIPIHVVFFDNDAKRFSSYISKLDDDVDRISISIYDSIISYSTFTFSDGKEYVNVQIIPRVFCVNKVYSSLKEPDYVKEEIK